MTIEPVLTVLSNAVFSRDDVLVACFDTDLRSELDGGTWTAKDRREAIARANASDAGDIIPGDTTVTIEQDCAHAFGDRLELASCAAGDVFVAHYYSFELLENDREMRDCIKTGGNWSALSRDSDEYRRAKARHDAERALQEVDRLQRRLGSH